MLPAQVGEEGGRRSEVRCGWRLSEKVDAEASSGSGRDRPRYRKDAEWDSDTRNRVAQPNCCGAGKTLLRGLLGG